MTAGVALNRVRRGFYLDSVALMRLAEDVSALDNVTGAALMLGTEPNKRILDDAGLLAEAGRAAGPNDLVLAVRGTSRAAAEAALSMAEARLDQRRGELAEAEGWCPHTLRTAVSAMPDANIALISVPGAYAAREARKALRSGLHAMVFSDNVPVEDERALKEEARVRGLLVMGPDCGTAIIGGVPLGFANAVPRGTIGAVAASGTGLQEVSSLFARHGGGISHGIGAGGRDLDAEVGGLTTLAAIDALDRDGGTERIVLISKPPAPEVAARVLERIARSGKRFTVCFLGMDAPELPGNAAFAPTLRAAAEDALGGLRIAPEYTVEAPASAGERRRIVGLYSGGTLCAEAQLVLLTAGWPVGSNAPVPGAGRAQGIDGGGNLLIDLGADEYTLGRPHPMLEPSVRRDALSRALNDPSVAVVLVDVVIGYGANEDPAGHLVRFLAGRPANGPWIVASVCGTEADPQVYSEQVKTLTGAGVAVAPSNAHAAEAAVTIAARRS